MLPEALTIGWMFVGGGGAGGEDDEETTAWPDAAVDVLLALLSKRTAPLPSAPLREAVEGAFRAMADCVTATGEPPCSEAYIISAARDLR